MVIADKPAGPGRVMRQGYGSDGPGRPIPANIGDLVKKGQIKAQEAGKHIGRPLGSKNKK